MPVAAKAIFCAYILVNGATEEIKEAENDESLWEFVKSKLNKEFIDQIGKAVPTKQAKAKVR